MTTLPYPISASQVDARSPVDDALMGAIRDNLDYLYDNAQSQQAYDYQFKVNGNLNLISSSRYYRLDGALITRDQTFSQCFAYLEDADLGGTFSVDLRTINKVNIAIASLKHQFTSAINSIARTGSGLSTQSISRATAQLSTQSITLWKSTINVSSIVYIGRDTSAGLLWRYNLASAPDSDWIVGDSVTFASSTNPANDVTATIVRIGEDGGNNVVVRNDSGVAQTSASGTVQLNAWKYNFTGAVPAQFAAGQSGKFATHTTGGNNGTLPIYAINQGGNNIIVKNASGATQGGVAGTADTNQWIFAQSASVSATDYVVGESAVTSGHTSGNNDGTFPIMAVNSGGNNVVLYNTAGVVQGGAAGTTNTSRWTYFFSVDPSANVTAGDTIYFSGATTAANNGAFVVKQVDRSTSDNIVVYNTGGVAQGGAVGNAYSSKRIVAFASDQSALITILSRIKLINTEGGGTYDGEFDVTAVNRGGGSNYNAVIDTTTLPMGDIAQACGRVALESKSIFDTRPSVTINSSYTNVSDTSVRVSSNAVFNATRKIVTAGTLLGMDIVSLPSGSPRNLVVQLR
jgi:hypothetical protein